MENSKGNIVRTIGGTSRKEAERIKITANKSDLIFSSPEEARFHGKDGGKKLGEYKEEKE
ncbi:MAG: hypothetical protein QM535_09770 [Limnohabitans sp.]|nr:hypothetical protein [Limnohabitans sp.]